MGRRLGRAWRVRRDQILARDGFRCHWCGGRATTADHVVPRALGGSDKPENLVAACTSCNCRRGAELGASRSPQERRGGGGRKVYPGALDPTSWGL